MHNGPTMSLLHRVDCRAAGCACCSVVQPDGPQGRIAVGFGASVIHQLRKCKQDDVLRGVYAYGFERLGWCACPEFGTQIHSRPSPVQQRAIRPVLQGSEQSGRRPPKVREWAIQPYMCRPRCDRAITKWHRLALLQRFRFSRYLIRRREDIGVLPWRFADTGHLQHGAAGGKSMMSSYLGKASICLSCTTTHRLLAR